MQWDYVLISCYHGLTQGLGRGGVGKTWKMLVDRKLRIQHIALIRTRNSPGIWVGMSGKHEPLTLEHSEVVKGRFFLVSKL